MSVVQIARWPTRWHPSFAPNRSVTFSSTREALGICWNMYARLGKHSLDARSKLRIHHRPSLDLAPVRAHPITKTCESNNPLAHRDGDRLNRRPQLDRHGLNVIN
ncbi:BZ3500_MvSof-1268-A1-R1_C141g00752 [Microbotryum saponariae]|uniref:BZ3500_MvSof-1268-A1-R1_C141g00752 protein n=1 Tax=Microbotryum saponariae TaxID=289078 RepID=A0A2X0MKN2_9BASI|nr:BZ3500_MvSof-1268-A1-R1_C141g00752 [Microbotryum saponariae]